MNSKLYKVLIIIPAYNEEESIDAVIRNLQENANENNYQVDYLVVNDCSKDRTLEVLEEGKRSYVSLPINLGIGGGVQCGYLYAKENGYDIAIQMDGDGQHDPQYIDDLVKPILNDEADMTLGSRFIDKEGFQSSALRRFGIRFLSTVIQCVSGIKIKDVTSGFRAVNRKILEEFADDYAQDYPEPESLVVCAKKKYRIKEVAVVMRERQGGESSISPFRSVYYMIKVTIAILFRAM